MIKIVIYSPSLDEMAVVYKTANGEDDKLEVATDTALNINDLEWFGYITPIDWIYLGSL